MIWISSADNIWPIQLILFAARVSKVLPAPGLRTEAPYAISASLLCCLSDGTCAPVDYTALAVIGGKRWSSGKQASCLEIEGP